MRLRLTEWFFKITLRIIICLRDINRSGLIFLSMNIDVCLNGKSAQKRDVFKFDLGERIVYAHLFDIIIIRVSSKRFNIYEAIRDARFDLTRKKTFVSFISCYPLVECTIYSFMKRYVGFLSIIIRLYIIFFFFFVQSESPNTFIFCFLIRKRSYLNFYSCNY